MSKRRSASMLVANSVPTPKGTWFDKLCSVDRTYVQDIVTEMKATVDVAPYLVAEAVRVELSLSTSKDTIARTLKELMNETP